MRMTDLLGEALTSLSIRPFRTVTTALGTVLGVAALVGIVGTARTAELQVSNRFDLLQATEVLGTVSVSVNAGELETRLREVPLVREAGVFRQGTQSDVSTIPPTHRAVLSNINIVFASPGFFPAREVGLLGGRTFDGGHVKRGDRVAVIGAELADRLGVAGVATRPHAIWINDIPYDVIGVIDDSPRMSSLLSSVVLPISLAAATRDATTFTVLTELGDATRVASAVQVAAIPTDPTAVTVVRPPEPRDYVEEIRGDIRNLVTSAAALALIIGALGIANVTSVSIVERTAELGLRLALGAKRRHVASQIALEAALTGLWGGLVGSGLGVMAVVIVASANGWSPAVPPMLTVTGPLTGLGVGVLAGLIPALRTASIQPDRALRTE